MKKNGQLAKRFVDIVAVNNKSMWRVIHGRQVNGTPCAELSTSTTTKGSPWNYDY